MEENNNSEIIPVQHDIPSDSPRNLKFMFLKSGERRIEDEDFKILPVDKYGENSYAFVVEFEDSDEQHPCYILNTENDLVGWCRCESFGETGVCRDLYAAHQWKRKMIKAENEETAREALKNLDSEEQSEDNTQSED